jgi:hypothetical protein
MLSDVWDAITPERHQSLAEVAQQMGADVVH